MTKNPIVLVCCTLLGLALLPVPYGYYQFLRLAVCALCIWTAISKYKERGDLTVVPVIIAILYNPIFVIHFARPMWQVLNVMSILLLCIYAFAPHKKSA